MYRVDDFDDIDVDINDVNQKEMEDEEDEEYEEDYLQDDIPIDDDDDEDDGIISDNYENIEDRKPETTLIKSTEY